MRRRVPLRGRFPSLSLLLALILPLLMACQPSTTPPAGRPAGQGTAAGSPVTLKVGYVTPIVDYWPFYIARSEGFFAREGLQVELVYLETASKVIQALAAGSLDIAASTTDASINAVEQGAPLVQVAGVSNKALYTLVVGKSITSYADLKGKTLAVADLKDGSTTLLRKMLAEHGLGAGDYSLVPLGGTGKRAAGIVSGQVAGALIGLPNSFVLEADGYASLGYTADSFPAYQFQTISVQRDWAQGHSDALERYLRALNAATGWLYDPANAAAAQAILAQELRVSPEIAAKTYDLAVVRQHLFPKAGEISREGFLAVLQAMGELELLRAPLPSPDKYIDAQYLARAQEE